jgi:Na+-driven multidrug efflux pump
MFTTDPVVVPHAIDCLRIIAFGNIAYAFGMVLVQTFNGAGDTVTPTLINIVGFWMFEIPLAWALAYPGGMGVRGVFTSIPIAEALISILGAVFFLRGNWKRRVI